MSLRTKLLPARQAVFETVEALMQTLAKAFGFPQNPGMPLKPTTEYFWNRYDILDEFPEHPRGVPVHQQPANVIETIFGDFPKISAIPRLFYYNENDGFYSFYLQNYRNMVFLPNNLSEFLQVQCHFCLDLTTLEVWRQTVFAMLLCYIHMINFRFYMTWLATINPYTMPWSLLTAVVDWTEELFLGLLPTIFGVNPGGIILSTMFGMIADSLCHLVYTMPFLPSEGDPITILLNGERVDVLRFRYLPSLWYKHPIPNEVREFWYTQRPEILNYMRDNYHQLQIEFLPDRIVNKQPLLSALAYLSNHESVNVTLANMLCLDMINSLPHTF